MKLLTENEILNFSFPDTTVTDMNIDVVNRAAEIKTSSGYLAINGGIKLESCKIILKDWQSVHALLYRAETKQWEKLDKKDIEKLNDICEFEHGEKIIFRGFGSKTGQWIEITFDKASLAVEYD